MHVSGFDLWELSPVSTVLCSTNKNSLYIYIQCMIVAVIPNMYLYIIDDIIPAYYPHTNSIRVQFITGLNV